MINKGAWAAFGAYFSWGLFPIYWKILNQVPAVELLSHRVFWSFWLLLVLLIVGHQWGALRDKINQPKVLLTFMLSACLLATNWLTYIWAVNAGYIVDASLGYFINPLVNVVFGVLFLKERLRFSQAVAIGIATLGVVYLTVSYGVVLWIALTLAISFAIYGLLRKTASLGSLTGLSLEMAFLLLPAIGYLLYSEQRGVGTFGHTDGMTTALLVATGAVTAFPLLLFAYGAQRVRLITLGILQYVAPSLQFLIGVFLYGEVFTVTRMIGFGIIWAALAIYTIEGALFARRKR